MPNQPHYPRRDTAAWEDMPPSEAQIGAIANQARCLGVPACVPGTRAAASAVIRSNSAAIAARGGNGRPVSARTLEAINRLEKQLGRHWLTGPDTVNAPRTSSAAGAYIRKLAQELSWKREDQRRPD